MGRMKGSGGEGGEGVDVGCGGVTAMGEGRGREVLVVLVRGRVESGGGGGGSAGLRRRSGGDGGGGAA